ncbi:alpha-(1,3)-fucosyltransferase 7 [Pholidichthys leucotaenia]
MGRSGAANVRPPLHLFILLILLSLLSLLVCLRLLNLYALQRPFHPDVPQRNITVLLWHWPFGRPYSLFGDTCLRMFNISSCLLTDRRSAFSSADVVVFHHLELSLGLSSLPLHLPRSPAQRWVWMSMEPPINNQNLTPFNGLFNWTLSYRRDADIHVPYGETLAGGDKRGDFQDALNRSCLVSWVVSKYLPGQRRSRVYQSLRMHIPIEVYGRWTRRPVPHRQLLSTISKCLFYLSFENSEARDYISEKLWRNAYQAGVVPVVLGPSRATYEAVAPPHSFIHVSDFRSSEQLAAHLKEVAVNRQLYENYFHWRRSHRIKTYTDWRERLCQICRLYPRLEATKVYQDLDTWVNQ